MSIIFRAVAYAAWALAFGLSIWLAVEFHEYQFGIAPGVAILALVLSAFGLVLARHAARQKDWPAAAIGVTLWSVSAMAFATCELGFWSYNYNFRYAEYAHAKSEKARQEGMTDLAWDAIRTGNVRATAAEIEARISALKQNFLWTSSASCSAATASKSRVFCKEYFDLVAQQEAARKLESMETRLLVTPADQTQTLVHNVFAAADLIAGNTNLTEKQAATIVILIIAAVLMLSRDLLLILANPFGGRAAPANVIPRPELSRERTPVQSGSIPDPNGGRSLPVVTFPQISEDIKNPKHDTKNVTPFPTQSYGGNWKIRKGDTSVHQWLRVRTAAVTSGGLGSREIYPDYEIFCLNNRIPSMKKNKFSRVLSGEFGLPRPRKGAVLVFPLRLVEVRRAAA